MARLQVKETHESAGEVEVLDEDRPSTMNLDAGIILGATVCMVVAIVFVLLALRAHYQAGLLA